jgi:hypothetical protein
MCPGYWAKDTRGSIGRPHEYLHNLVDVGVHIVTKQGEWSWVEIVQEVGALSGHMDLGMRVLLRARPHEANFQLSARGWCGVPNSLGAGLAPRAGIWRAFGVVRDEFHRGVRCLCIGPVTSSSDEQVGDTEPGGAGFHSLPRVSGLVPLSLQDTVWLRIRSHSPRF